MRETATSIVCTASGLMLFVATAWSAEQTRPAAAYVLKPGPQLFIDDFLIERSEHVRRRVLPPQHRPARPIVTAAGGHKNWQPWLTVIHDPTASAEKKFRMWYSADVVDDPADQAYETKLGYLESADGEHWPGPNRYLERTDSILFGASVLDDGPNSARAAERYKMVYWRHPKDQPPGPAAAFSPDGLQWTVHDDGRPIVQPSPGGDSWHAGYDPLRKRYFLIGKSNQLHTWTNAEGRQLTKRLRLFGTAVSDDFKTWSELKMWFAPDEKDPGITEGYAVTGFQVRGDLIVGFLQILRDDLTAEGAPQAAIDANLRLNRTGAGMGHTVLCWTRDGLTWQRDRESDAFLIPSPTVGAWDHAMAWVSSVVPIGDELYVYYAGYRWGHKYRRSEDRQVGLVKLARDRYAAREAGELPGKIVTRPLTIAADSLTLNVAAAQGEVRVAVCEPDGRPIAGYEAAACRPIRGDVLDAPVEWQAAKFSTLRGRTVRLEITLQQAQLFAVDAR